MKKKNKASAQHSRHKSGSLRIHIWTSFMIFTVIILVLLWLFQYVFLAGYYETMKARDLEDTADKISDNIDSKGLSDRIKRLAFVNSFCVVVTDSQCNLEIGENAIGSFSVLETDVVRNFKRYIYSLKNDYNASDDDAITVKMKDDDSSKTSVKKMIYVTSAVDSQGETHYIFIESATEPIDATVSIIKEQLIYITIILFVLAFLLTLIISKRISMPLTKLAKTAESFAEGDYSVKFEYDDYAEIKQLSDVLNDAGTEMSKVTELRRDLIANVSHDLRTPLTIIKSYAEMIRDLSGDNPEKRSQHIQVIIDESDRLTGLVNSIMELSKLESTVRPLNKTAFSVNEMLSSVMTRYRVINERDGYNVHLENDEDAECFADTGLIEQVLYNLINNAVNYCGEDKEVLVKQINKDGFVRIEVTDHGKGIPKEQLDQIFDRYYRAPKTKRDVVGTGLGLSIVKEILKQHKFPFGVCSTEGKGSVFWFEIARSSGEENKQ